SSAYRQKPKTRRHSCLRSFTGERQDSSHECAYLTRPLLDFARIVQGHRQPQRGPLCARSGNSSELAAGAGRHLATKSGALNRQRVVVQPILWQNEKRKRRPLRQFAASPRSPSTVTGSVEAESVYPSIVV